MGDLGNAVRRKAPAASRNVEPIGDVLSEWLPDNGLLLEVASGTGEHALAFARRFPMLTWQPSDPDPLALSSIAAWQSGGPTNLRKPLALDAASSDWPIKCADALLNINMVHISPWDASLGLLDGASHLLKPGGRLILYGPWLEKGVDAAPSNLAFDADLKARDPRWGLRLVEDFAAAAQRCGFQLMERRQMPANNLMLLFVKGSSPSD
jgi:SAM-dependent methyltransferase